MEAVNKAILQKSAWTDQILSRLGPVHDLIAAHWHASCDSTAANMDFSGLKSLQPANHLDTIIHGLDRYVSQIALRKSAAGASSFTPTSKYPVFPVEELPDNLDCPSERTFFRLAAVERWTEEHLESWIEQCSPDLNVCEQLRCLVIRYYTTANKEYVHTPLKLSIM